ncbi:histone-lysine N-methyltransferase SETMAR-like [Homalodisca vitripennis]|uniref:histone-lysine N-methyltransferase SETMAR-like n=1 Tax=Homalodisca vitripennis TaxID=197043 RepID=UPI001EEA2774|nr:histone-lysine N-methyltransferase SETMAR-like [Homalodisca vitripennis]
MVYTHTILQGQTINGEYYILVLKQLIKDHFPKKQPDPVGLWKLHHDNARPHVANTVLQFLPKKGIETVPHSPYSPDLAPNNFFLYAQAKKELKGRRFPTATAAIKIVETILKVLSKEGFEHVFSNEWQRRWNKCVALNGEYLEGDTSVKV